MNNDMKVNKANLGSIQFTQNSKFPAESPVSAVAQHSIRDLDDAKRGTSALDMSVLEFIEVKFSFDSVLKAPAAQDSPKASRGILTKIAAKIQKFIDRFFGFKTEKASSERLEPQEVRNTDTSIKLVNWVINEGKSLTQQNLDVLRKVFDKHVDIEDLFFEVAVLSSTLADENLSRTEQEALVGERNQKLALIREKADGLDISTGASLRLKEVIVGLESIDFSKMSEEKFHKLETQAMQTIMNLSNASPHAAMLGAGIAFSGLQTMALKELFILNPAIQEEFLKLAQAPTQDQVDQLCRKIDQEPDLDPQKKDWAKDAAASIAIWAQ